MLKFKVVARTAPLLLLLVLGGVNLAKAQGFSPYLGFGTAFDSSNGQDLECSPSNPNADNPSICPVVLTNPDVGPKMTGLFGVFGADYMWKPTLGFGGEYSWRTHPGPFAPQEAITFRPAFYDFNAIWHPIGKGSRVVPEIQGGIGGAHTKFYETGTGCVAGNIGCTTVNEYIDSSNHFAVHFSGGIRFYFKGGFYLRPQFDGRYVPHFVEFGSDFVPEVTVALGYTFGSH